MWNNDHCGSGQCTDAAADLSNENSLHMFVSESLFMRIQSQYFTCNNNCLFNWSDMYLGMNRVVGGSYRSGSGLCHVCLKWEPSVPYCYNYP